MDATGNNSVDCKDVLSLKTEILNTLSMLPINNRNILEDSKVLAMVKRWADGMWFTTGAVPNSTCVKYQKRQIPVSCSQIIVLIEL